MSSHFIPEPRSRMISASSVGLHLEDFLAGEPSGRSSLRKRLLAGATAAGLRLGFCSKTARDVVERRGGWGWRSRDCCRRWS